MISMTLSDIAAVTGGRLNDAADPAAVVTAPVEFDSRAVVPGGLFVALPGERVDGHDYAPAAMDRGAVGVFAARDVSAPAIILPVAVDTPAAVTDAVLGGLSRLATHVAAELIAEHGLQVIGVTGSAGKTSTKDLLATVFATAGTTVAPPGSFNNELGHPYTVLRCDEDTRFLVSELSARGVGHIAYLARIAQPSIGVVLNVGSAHLGEFGSREAIAQAKGELVEALPTVDDGGVAVLNADDELVAGMAGRTAARVVTFSATHTPADYRASDVVLDEVARPSFTLSGPGFAPQRVQLQVFGAHQVANAVAAAAAAIEAGLDASVVAQALSAHTAASAHRMAVLTRTDGTTIIDDSYNANPESMKAAVAALAYTVRAHPAGRSIAVLGEMSELGEDGLGQHAAVGRQLGDRGIDVLITVGGGALTAAMATAARNAGVTAYEVADSAAAAAMVEELIRTRSADVAGGQEVVLVKASNAARLWQVAEQLTG